jgi:hypothetical protein
MNQFIFSAGIGTVHQRKIKAQRNEWSGHLELQYSRFFDKEKKFSLDLKAQGMFCQTNFDGIVLKHDRKKSIWWDINTGFSVGFTYYIKKRHWDRCLPGAAPVYNINQTIVMPENKCPEYGTMVFYVFFPNNYSGRNDAPTMVDGTVNAIDYLAAGMHTQTKFENAETVTKYLALNKSLAGLRTSDISVEDDAVMGSGYEMSQTPISLSMNADSMEVFKDKYGYYPKVVTVRGVGAYLLSDSEKQLGIIKSIFLDQVTVCANAEAFGGYFGMSDDLVDFIVNWEVESYRSKVSGG